MLTIKHITPEGEEYVHATTHINFVPASAKNCAPAKDSLWWYDADGRAFEVKVGLVYAMNADGKTVARYRLNEEDVKDQRRPPFPSIAEAFAQNPPLKNVSQTMAQGLIGRSQAT